MVKEPRKDVRKTPMEPAEEISHLQEGPKEMEVKEVRESSGGLAMASTAKPPKESVGRDPERTQVVMKSYPPARAGRARPS